MTPPYGDPAKRIIIPPYAGPRSSGAANDIHNFLGFLRKFVYHEFITRYRQVAPTGLESPHTHPSSYTPFSAAAETVKSVFITSYVAMSIASTCVSVRSGSW